MEGGVNIRPLLELVTAYGGFLRALSESKFLRSKNCRVPQPPQNPREPMAVPCIVPNCQTGASNGKLQT